jgi:hypothetical protein
MLVMFECTVVVQRQRNLRELRSLQTPKQRLQVYRAGKWEVSRVTIMDWQQCFGWCALYMWLHCRAVLLQSCVVVRAAAIVSWQV